MSIKRHRRFVALLGAGKPIPDELVTWYLEGCKQHIEENKPLCICLGIRGPGIRSEKNTAKMESRNRNLKYAVSSCHGKGVYQKCGVLSGLIGRWPRSRKENPLLPHLFALNIKIPKSQDGIYAIVKTTL